MTITNPACDGSGPCTLGEVRVLPIGEDSNAILCRACFWREIDERKHQNGVLRHGLQWETPDWNDLKVYEG